MKRKTISINNPYSERPIDICENLKEYFINISMPDFQQEDVSVNVTHDILKISVIRQIMVPNRKEKLYERKFKLPANADPHSIRASLNSGILSVRIDKSHSKITA